MSNEKIYVTMTKFLNGAPQEKWVFECDNDLEATRVRNNASMLQVFKQIRTRRPVGGRIPSYSYIRTQYMNKYNQPAFYEERDTLTTAVSDPIGMILRALETAGVNVKDIRIDISINKIIDKALADQITEALNGFTFGSASGFPALVHNEHNVAITPFYTQRVNYDLVRSQDVQISDVESGGYDKPKGDVF